MVVRRGLRSLVLLATLGLVLGFPLAATAKDTVAFTIDDPRITESSGLAADSRASAYWTVNDSGSKGTAYAVRPDGTVSGSLKYRAQPVDVEAMAMHDGRLYLADIGDNGKNRDTITVYYFDDAQADDRTVSYRSWEFRYPDGAHDAEALLVDDAGRLYIVIKSPKGAVYAAPRQPARTRINELTRVGEAPAMVTDGTFLPGGKRIALLTYGKVVVVDAEDYSKVADAIVPPLVQPESMTVSLDGSSLLVGTEGKPSLVYALPVPGGSTAGPTATPSGSTSAEPEPSEEEGEAGGRAGQSRARTLLALGVAALVAIIAGSVVTVARKP